MKTSHSVSSLLLRTSSIFFAVGTLAAFVWYAQVRAKQPATVQAPFKSPIMFSGSKSYSGPVVSSSDKPLMTGSKSGIFVQQVDQSDSIDGLIQEVQESKSRHPGAPKIEYTHPFPLRAPQVMLSSPIVSAHVSDLPEPKPALPETKAVGVPAAPRDATPANQGKQGKGQLMWGSKAPGGPLIGK